MLQKEHKTCNTLRVHPHAVYHFFFIHLSSVFKLLLKPLAPAPAHALTPPSGVAPACNMRNRSRSAASCEPFLDALRELRQQRRSLTQRGSVAVCLTGQLRLFMLSFPGLVKHLLAPLAAEARVDFFYVGPADASFAHGRRWLQQVPALRLCSVYSPVLRWASRTGAPLYEELPSPNRSSSYTAPRNRTVATAVARHHRAQNSTGAFGLLSPAELSLPMSPPSSLPSLRLGVRTAGCSEANARSRLVQAWQARRCLQLIEHHEASQSARRRMPWNYDAILRVRADALPTRKVELPLLSSLLTQPTFTPLDGCPARGESRLANHDFALLGRRDVMAAALRAVDTLDQNDAARSGRQGGRRPCDFDRLMGAAVRRVLPDAKCVALPRGGSPVASVRGNVRGGCFFLDIESPPNDGQPQPRVGALRLDAVASVASQCLGLEEQRDPRRPGTGAACAPRGGWDGDFRTDASPWDAGPPNRGAG